MNVRRRSRSGSSYRVVCTTAQHRSCLRCAPARCLMFEVNLAGLGSVVGIVGVPGALAPGLALRVGFSAIVGIWRGDLGG